MGIRTLRIAYSTDDLDSAPSVPLAVEREDEWVKT